MAMTSVDLDRELLEAAKRATGQKTARGAITAALETVVQRAGQVEAIKSLAQMESLGDLMHLDPDASRKANHEAARMASRSDEL